MFAQGLAWCLAHMRSSAKEKSERLFHRTGATHMICTTNGCNQGDAGGCLLGVLPSAWHFLDDKQPS